MTKKILWTTVVVVILVVIIVVSRGNKDNTKIKVGVLAPLSGIVADYGEQIKSGVESVVSSSTRVQFIFEDTQCDAKTAVSSFKKLTDLDHVNYIIGPACGSPQDAIAPLLKNTNYTVVVPSAASNSLYDKSAGNMYDMQYSLEDEASFIADNMYNMGYKNVALISYQNDFSKAETDAFKAKFKGKVSDDVVFATDNSDIQTELTKIKNDKFDAIFVVDISFYFSNGLSKLHNLGIDKPVFSPYTVELPAVRKLVEGVYYAFPKGINDGKGGVYGISAQVAGLFISALDKCDDNYSCVRDYIKSSGFNQYGVKERELELKQIKNGQPVEVGL